MTITYQQEFLETFRDEAEVLIHKHWEEIALNKDKIKLNPDWEMYSLLESNGALKIFTARSDDKLVGYFVVLVGTNIHYKDHLFASNDVIYLDPEYRKGMTGIKLIKAAEKWLKDDGVSVLVINTKVHRPFDSVLERLGFNLIERVYSKRLKDK